MAGRIHHWKHGWIPLDSVALAEKEHGHANPKARARLAATALLQKVSTVEPQVTHELRDHAAAQSGGQMVGLDFRMKSPDSLARKLATKAEERGTAPEVEAKRVGDVLRYTMIFPHQRYTEGVKKATDHLRAEGYKVTLENNWPKGVIYKGINGNVVTPSGQTFELQFHTPESFNQKEGQHATGYEVLRDPAQPVEKRRAAYRMMEQAWKNIPVPAGVATIDTVVQPKGEMP